MLNIEIVSVHGFHIGNKVPQLHLGRHTGMPFEKSGGVIPKIVVRPGLKGKINYHWIVKHDLNTLVIMSDEHATRYYFLTPTRRYTLLIPRPSGTILYAMANIYVECETNSTWNELLNATLIGIFSEKRAHFIKIVRKVKDRLKQSKGKA